MASAAARLMSLVINGETFEVVGDVRFSGDTVVGVDSMSDQDAVVSFPTQWIMTCRLNVAPGAFDNLFDRASSQKKKRRAQWKREQGLARFH